MNPTEQQSDGVSEFTSSPAAQYPDGKPESRKDGSWAKMPPPSTWWRFFLILLMNYLLAMFLIPNPDTPVTVPYTLFKQEVGKGNVDVIFCKGEMVKGRFKAPVMYPPDSARSAALSRRSLGRN